MRQNKNGHWLLKLFAFVLAVIIVIAVRFLNVTDRVVTIPLSVILDSSSSYRPSSLIPETIEVVIQGDDNVIYLVDPSLISASVDFTKIDKEGVETREVYLEYDEDLFSNTALNITCKPESIKILFEKKDD